MKYVKFLQALAQRSKTIFEEMTGTEVINLNVKKDERGPSNFAVAQVIKYKHQDQAIEGKLVLGINDESMAILVASAIAKTMGLEPVKEIDETAADILAELMNTVVGRTITDWEKMGLPVRFSPPSWVKFSSVESYDNLYTEAYIIILSLDISHIVFQVTFSEPKETEGEKRILVVDDSMVIRGALRMAMEKAGLVVGEAANGKEAVEAHQSFKPHLTMMDLIMPEMGGLDAIIEIRQVDPEAKFIILTSSSQQDEVVTANTMGVEDYLIKPVKMDSLMETVRKALA